MDLKGFKKIGSTDTHTTFQHADGHVLHVANKALDKSKRNEMKQIPEKKLADGTPDGSVGDQVSDAQNGRMPASLQPDPNVDYNPQETPADPVQAQTSMNKPVYPQDPMSGLPGYDESKQATEMTAAKEQDIGQAEAQMRHKQTQQQMGDMAHHQRVLADMQKNIDALSADVKNGHINPNHYMESRSTGQKVATAIGLLLGGISQGFGASSNPAMAFLNNQIERDLESQKANLGQKATLLGALQKQYGNYAAAADMFRLFRANQVASEIGEVAAKSKSAMAIPNKLKALADLHQTYLPIQQRAAALQVAHEMNQQGSQQQPNDPSSLVQYLVPKDHQEQVFKEIQQAQNAHNTESKIMDAFDRADKENTVLKTGAGMLRTPAAVSEIRALALPLIHDQEGRVNEFEQKTLMDLEPKPGDMPAKVQEKRKALESFIESKKAAPRAKGYGIDLSRILAQPPKADIAGKGGKKFSYDKASGGYRKVK